MSLADDLRLAGLNVQTVSGWGARGSAWAVGEPVAVMHHHTAPPVPFPVSRLYGSLNKCNINTKPDGTVWLLVGRACNYSSGMGSSVVLAEATAGEPPTKNAIDRDLGDDINGNPWFFNFENDHAGDGGPIPQVQLDAIVTATRVVLNHYALVPGNVISHAEWTRRKGDPYWNGSRRCIEDVRRALEDDDMKPPTWAVEATQWHIDTDIYSESSTDDIDEPEEFHRQTVFRHRMWTRVIAPAIGDGSVNGLKRGDSVKLV
jgi:hypothetical protein